MEYSDRNKIRFNRKSLQEIVTDFTKIAANKRIVCHNAPHDCQVIKNTFELVGTPWQNFKFACTWELAKKQFVDLESHSLEFLAKKLNLQVDGKYFNERQAHTARYDTAFTYQLYRKIINYQMATNTTNTPNPFSSSRVDNPFQSHPDLTSIHQQQFNSLKAIIPDIKHDLNHQSKGAVIIGEPGTGKTHLMMRLANEVLANNRLLFIRQPNNPDAIIYHIYSRILESLIKKVPESNYTQLEHLLANSFVRLIRTNIIANPSQKEQHILESTDENTLKLYDSLGSDSTQKKREYWQYIEKRVIDWWLSKYGSASYSLSIVRGIIKYCSYSDPNYKRLINRWLAADILDEDESAKIGLPNWKDDLTKESFSLEAISVFSKLSLLDEPLIIVFDQLEGLGLPHNRTLLLNFGEAIKEIFTHVFNSLIILNLFPDRWQQFQELFDGSVIGRISQHQLTLNKPTPKELKQILQTKTQSLGLDINSLFSDRELQEIVAQNSIRAVLNRAYYYYRSKVNQISSVDSTVEKKDIVELPERSESTTERLERLETKLEKLETLFKNIAGAFNTFNSGENNSSATVTEENPDSDEIDITTNPLIDYFKEQRLELGDRYNYPQIIDDSDDLGKLRTIAEAFKSISNIELDHLRLGKKRLPEHFLIKKNNRKLCIGFLQIGGGAFTSRLKNYNSLVIINKDIQFILFRDRRQTAISGKVGKEEIAKLNNAPNGNFLTMGQENRVNFELIYKLIVDIQNKDLEIPLEEALAYTRQHFQNYWLIESLT